MEKQTMGAFISALRKSKGITQKELAELLNVSDKAVSRWECDQTAPDIYLLPLIADIFEISVDELIRGGRIKAEQPTESQEKNIQKRLEAIIENKFSSYRIKSIIPIMLVAIGIIIGFVCKWFNVYVLGYGISLLLFVCAIALQIIFLLNFKGSITSELDNESISKIKLKEFDFSSWIFTGILCIEALIISIDWHLFLWCGPALSILVFLICVLIKSVIIKKSRIEFTEKRNHNAKLYIKVFASFAIIVSVLAASMVMINANCNNWIEKPVVFEVTDSTKEIESYIENQLLCGYGQCAYPIDEEEIDNEIKVTITDDNDLIYSDAIEYTCFINGFSINEIEKDGKSCKEVKLWTESTRLKSRTILDNINIIYIILYFACAISAITIYIIKSKKK